jgi:hypothetical protein
MNAYAIRSLEEIQMYSQDEINPAEYGYIYDVVIAKNRGQAHSTIVNEYEYCEYTEPLSIRLLCKDIDHAPGIIGEDSLDDIALRIQAFCVWFGASDIAEWEAWEAELTMNLEYHPEALAEIKLTTDSASARKE